MPGAPGEEAGLDATVAWVATYPGIDLDSPPTYSTWAVPPALGEPKRCSGFFRRLPLLTRPA